MLKSRYTVIWRSHNLHCEGLLCGFTSKITVFGNTHAQKLKLKWLSKRRHFTCLEYRGTFLLNFLCTAMGPSGAGTLRAGGHLQCWHSDPPFYLHLNPPGPHQPSTPPSLVAAACKTPHCAHVPGSAGNPTCKKVEGEWGALMIFLRSSAIAIFLNIIRSDHFCDEACLTSLATGIGGHSQLWLISDWSNYCATRYSQSTKWTKFKI